jgi:hypothetical protein
MSPCKIWIEQCEAARNIEDNFGTDSERVLHDFNPLMRYFVKMWRLGIQA